MYLGIDGGGSKTTAVLIEGSGSVVASSVGPGSAIVGKPGHSRRADIRIQLRTMRSNDVFRQLMSIVAERKINMPEKSYTTELLRGGVDAIGGKIKEEAGEVVDAASEPGNGGRAHVIHEAADLIFHLFVLLGHCEISLEEIEGELRRRFGVSGLVEKAARGKKGE